MRIRSWKRANQLLQSINLTDLVRRDGNLPVLLSGAEDGSIISKDQPPQVVIIERLVVNINYASGGGAKVKVLKL